LVTGFTDIRKSINGLSIIVSDILSLDPLSQAWFVFYNKQRDKLKILFWDTNGFWLYCRRLEQGRFRWPKSAAAHTAISIEQKQLVRLQVQIDTLQAEKQAWVEDKMEMQTRIDHLLAELKLSQSQKYGKKSEKAPRGTSNEAEQHQSSEPPQHHKKGKQVLASRFERVEAASTKSLAVKSLPLPNQHNLFLAVSPVLRR
jgi:transposase